MELGLRLWRDLGSLAGHGASDERLRDEVG